MKQYHILLLTLIFNTCQKTLCMEFFPDDLYIKIIACCDSNSKNELGKSCKKLNVLYSKNNLDLYCQSPLSLTKDQKAYALSYCTYKNCTIGVKNLLEHGAHSDYKGLNSRIIDVNIRALDIAENNKNNEIITLLQNAQVYISKRSPALSNHALAAYMGDVDQLTEYVHSKEYEPFYNKNNYETLLHLAIINGHAKVVDLLLQNKKTIECIDHEPIPRKSHNYAAHKGNANILEQLLKISTPIGINENSFFFSIEQGHLECVKSFLKYKPSLINTMCTKCLNVSTITNETKCYAITLSPLAMATFKKYYHIAEYLLSCDSIDINKAETYCFTPFYAASEQGAVDILQLLLKHPKLDATSYMDAYSALHIACQKKHTEIVRLLVTHHPKLINMKDEENKNTALHIACLYNGIEEAKILLQTPNININLTNCDGETAFDIAQKMKRPQIRTLLLKKIWSSKK